MAGESTPNDVWVSVIREKLDEVLQRIDKLEERMERRLDAESTDLHAEIEHLEERIRKIETQRWILGGAALAGGGSGLTAMLQTFLGG